MEQSALCTNQPASLLDIKCGVRYQNVMQCLTGHHLNQFLSLLLMHPLCTWLSSDTSMGTKNGVEVCVYIISRAWQTPGADSSLLHTICSENEKVCYESGRAVLLPAHDVSWFSHEIQRKNSKNFCFCECVHVCACVCGQRVTLRRLPLLLSTLYFETRSLSEPGAHQLAMGLVIFVTSVLWTLDYRHMPPQLDFYVGHENPQAKNLIDWGITPAQKSRITHTTIPKDSKGPGVRSEGQNNNSMRPANFGQQKWNI